MVLCGPGAGVGHSWEIRGQLWHSACHQWWGSWPVLRSMVWCDLVPVALTATDTSHPTVEKTKIVCIHLYNLQLDTSLTASHNIIFAIMIFLSSIFWPWWELSAHCAISNQCSSSYINESFTQRECLQNSYCSLRVKILRLILKNLGWWQSFRTAPEVEPGSALVMHCTRMFAILASAQNWASGKIGHAGWHILTYEHQPHLFYISCHCTWNMEAATSKRMRAGTEGVCDGFED